MPGRCPVRADVREVDRVRQGEDLHVGRRAVPDGEDRLDLVRGSSGGAVNSTTHGAWKSFHVTK
ncbi:hypothetical protein [Streptomyces yanii]|uniref:Uncharacterized protein n=1 Tax=Streptomyces yanii TaxID=78510 RepID=A0ABV5RPW9_9ACTN